MPILVTGQLNGVMRSTDNQVMVSSGNGYILASDLGIDPSTVSIPTRYGQDRKQQVLTERGYQSIDAAGGDAVQVGIGVAFDSSGNPTIGGYPVADRMAVPARRWGIIPLPLSDTTTNQYALFSVALAAASAGGFDLALEEGYYNDLGPTGTGGMHSNIRCGLRGVFGKTKIRLMNPNGVNVRWDWSAPANENRSGAILDGLQFYVTNTPAGALNDAAENSTVLRFTNWDNVQMRNVEIYGSYGGGVMWRNVTNSYAINCGVYGACKDSFHCTGLSENNTYQFCTVENGGDDAFACIGYVTTAGASQLGMPNGIKYIDCTVRGVKFARNFALAGTTNCAIIRCESDGKIPAKYNPPAPYGYRTWDGSVNDNAIKTNGSGLLLATESVTDAGTGNYTTGGNSGLIVENFIVRNCGRGSYGGINIIGGSVTTATATTVSGSTSITLTATTGVTGLGMTVSGAGIEPGSKVVSGPAAGGTGVYVLDKPATASASGVAVSFQHVSDTLTFKNVRVLNSGTRGFVTVGSSGGGITNLTTENMTVDDTSDVNGINALNARTGAVNYIAGAANVTGVEIQGVNDFTAIKLQIKRSGGWGIFWQTVNSGVHNVELSTDYINKSGAAGRDIVSVGSSVQCRINLRLTIKNQPQVNVADVPYFIDRVIELGTGNGNFRLDYFNCTSALLKNIVFPLPTVVTLPGSVPASPALFANTTSRPQLYQISGGTVSGGANAPSIALTEGVSSPVYNVVSTAKNQGFYWLEPGCTLKVEYSAAPTVNVFPIGPM